MQRTASDEQRGSVPVSHVLSSIYIEAGEDKASLDTDLYMELILDGNSEIAVPVWRMKSVFSGIYFE